MLTRFAILVFLLVCPALSDAQPHLEMLNEGETNIHRIIDKCDAYYAEYPNAAGYNIYMRWKMRHEPRALPSGKIQNTSYLNLRAYQKTISRLPAPQLQTGQRTTNGFWTFLGPGSYSLGADESGGLGRVNVITFHPNDEDIIYAGTPSGGLWRSGNGGSSWSPRTDGMAHIGVSGIAVSHATPTTVYILTGDGDAVDTYSIGIMKSYNSGVSWWPTSLSFDADENVRAYKLIMHPNNDQIMLAATSTGIFRTDDGWDTWDKVSTGNYTDIEFKPGDPTVMFAVTKDFMRSENTGLDWSEEADTDLPDSDFSRISLAICPANPEWIYLLYGGGSQGYLGLYRSINGGDNFALRSNSPNIMGKGTGTGTDHQASYDIALAIDPANSNNVYVGGINIWKSTNGGVSGWDRISYGPETTEADHYTHADIHVLEFENGNLYTGTDGGIFKSTNGGDTWSNLSQGLAITQYYKIAAFQGEFMGGSQDNGTSQWTIPSLTGEMTLGSDGFVPMIDYTFSDIRYSSTQHDKYLSVDAGMNWVEITPDGLSDFWNSDWIMHHSDSDLLYLGHSDVYRTTNGGQGEDGWEAMGAFNSSNPKVRALALGVSNDNRLYAANRNVIKTTIDANISNPPWTDITAGLPGGPEMTDVALDPLNDQRVWVVFNGYAAGEKIYYSPNAGGNWINVSFNLPNVPVNCVRYQAGSNDGIYIGTDIGPFYVNANLTEWQYYGNGLPNVPVYDLIISGNQLYAGTYGRGMWKTFLYSTCAANYTLTVPNDPSKGNFTGIQVYNASNSITSTRIVQGGIGTDVFYGSEDHIVLNPGFRAIRGNVFLATVADCPE